MYFYCICGKECDLRVLLFRHLPSLPLLCFLKLSSFTVGERCLKPKHKVRHCSSHDNNKMLFSCVTKSKVSGQSFSWAMLNQLEGIVVALCWSAHQAFLSLFFWVMHLGSCTLEWMELWSALVLLSVSLAAEIDPKHGLMNHAKTTRILT